MTLNTLLTILTWAGDRERTDRHLPTWQNRGAALEFFSPVDAPCHLGGPTAFKSQRFGVDLMRRIRAAMGHALGSDYPSYVFTEADSVVLRTIPGTPPNPEALNCFVYENRDNNFKAVNITHFAWWMTREVLSQIHKAMYEYDLSVEQGFPDRTLPYILEREHIPIAHAEPYIYSANELHDESHFKDIERMKDTLVFVHGVKTAEHFRRLVPFIVGRRQRIGPSW